MARDGVEIQSNLIGGPLARAWAMTHMASHWWMFVVRGVTSLALATILLLCPGWSSTEAVLLALSLFAFVDGAASLGFVAGAQNVRKKTYVARGLLGIVAGAVALAQPFPSTVALYVFVGGWAVASGLLEMAFGSRAWSCLPKPIAFMAAGSVSFGFGLTLLCLPLEGVPLLRAFFALYGVMNGVAAIALGEGLHHAAPAPLPAAA